MLFSTLSFSIDKHYCGGQLYSEAIFSHAKDCGMQQMDVCGDTNSTSNSIKNNGCCHNVLVFIKGQNLEQQAISTLILDVQQSAIIVDFKDFNFIADYLQQPTFYQNYSPPSLVKDIPVLDQSFLI